MSYMQVVWIKRGDKNSKKETIRNIKKRIDNHMKDPDLYGPLIMMPEGATTNGHAFLKF